MTDPTPDNRTHSIRPGGDEWRAMQALMQRLDGMRRNGDMPPSVAYAFACCSAVLRARTAVDADDAMRLSEYSVTLATVAADAMADDDGLREWLAAWQATQPNP